LLVLSQQMEESSPTFVLPSVPLPSLPDDGSGLNSASSSFFDADAEYFVQLWAEAFIQQHTGKRLRLDGTADDDDLMGASLSANQQASSASSGFVEEVVHERSAAESLVAVASDLRAAGGELNAIVNLINLMQTFSAPIPKPATSDQRSPSPLLTNTAQP